MNKLYLKLAWSNLKNSRQFYLPYVIAGMLSAMMFYTMCAIQGNEGLSKMRGGTSWSDRRRCVCQYLFVLYEQLYYEAQKKRTWDL